MANFTHLNIARDPNLVHSLEDFYLFKKFMYSVSLGSKGGNTLLAYLAKKFFYLYYILLHISSIVIEKVKELRNQ